MSAAAATARRWAVDDVVGVAAGTRPGRWQIKSVPGGRQKNYRLTPLEGQSIKDLMCPPYLLTDPPEPTAEGTGAGMAIGVPYREHYYIGQIVTCVQPIPTSTGTLQDRLLIVLADKGQRVNCVEPGGREDRYWRLPPEALQAVDADALLGTLSDAVRLASPQVPEGSDADIAFRDLLKQLRATRKVQRTSRGG
jgi:hypothetical protein